MRHLFLLLLFSLINQALIAQSGSSLFSLYNEQLIQKPLCTDANDVMKYLQGYRSQFLRSQASLPSNTFVARKKM